MHWSSVLIIIFYVRSYIVLQSCLRRAHKIVNIHVILKVRITYFLLWHFRYVVSRIVAVYATVLTVLILSPFSYSSGRLTQLLLSFSAVIYISVFCTWWPFISCMCTASVPVYESSYFIWYLFISPPFLPNLFPSLEHRLAFVTIFYYNYYYPTLLAYYG